MKVNSIIYYFLILAFLSSCSATKGLKENEMLFNGTSIEYINEKPTRKSNIKKKVTLSKIKPNTPGVFNLATGFYNIYDSTANTGFKHTIKYKLGSIPVIFNPDYVKATELRLSKVYTDYGYFQHTVTCDSTKNKRNVKINCQVDLGVRYMIDSVFTLNDSTQIARDIESFNNSSFLKTGDYYNRENIVAERTDYVALANNNGFPFVEDDDFYFFVDTTKASEKANIHIAMRQAENPEKYNRYRYGELYINPNYILEEDELIDSTFMLDKGKYHIKRGYDFLKNKALNKAIKLDEGRHFNAKNNKITIDRFLDFGLFKYVNLKGQVNHKNQTIDHYMNLTTQKLESISGEVEVNNRSGNFFGLGGKVSYTHKNLFKGAERFDLSLYGGAETQFQENQSFLNTLDLTLEGSLTTPGVILPGFSFRTNRNYIPKTYMSLAANYQERINFYTITHAKASYGFKWNETDTKSHYMAPLDMNWLVLRNTSPEFEQILANDRRLELSLRTTLIIGGFYDFVYNKFDKFNPTNQTYFNGRVEVAGNIFSLFTDTQANGDPGEILGTQFAQFSRFTADFRKYFALTARSSIATRAIAGVGFAYGNSTELPYSRQYSIGGSNSVRAFRLRGLGPGGYVSPVSAGNNQFIDQTGDIKLEFNVEYRFPIFGFVKGALFVDAGNVWLSDSDQRPEGIFKFDKFYDQLAVGTGLGLRFDFEFLLFRLDLAFPIRDIQSNGDFQWTFNNLSFGDSNWRSDNLVFNLGIGYPF